MSLRTALGITSGREKGALIEAIGTFEKRTIERSIWLGPCQSRKRGRCFAYSSGRRQRRVDRIERETSGRRKPVPDRALDPAHNLELFFGFILLDLADRFLLLESYSSRGPFEGLLSLSRSFSRPLYQNVSGSCSVYLLLFVFLAFPCSPSTMMRFFLIC